tara:strand:+ start:985 stop:1269 length:285 start_codon:yes stop_codon:yes gene_type:complete
MKNESYNIFGKVFGRVQGVGFRAWTKKTAYKYNLNGWVMNCSDKSVEFVVSGKKNNIDKFLDECSTGPILSNVKTLSLKKLPFSEYKSFEIKYL